MGSWERVLGVTKGLDPAGLAADTMSTETSGLFQATCLCVRLGPRVPESSTLFLEDLETKGCEDPRNGLSHLSLGGSHHDLRGAGCAAHNFMHESSFPLGTFVPDSG